MFGNSFEMEFFNQDILDIEPCISLRFATFRYCIMITNTVLANTSIMLHIKFAW